MPSSVELSSDLGMADESEDEYAASRGSGGPPSDVEQETVQSTVRKFRSSKGITIEITPGALLSVINSVNKQPRLQPQSEHFIEIEPFPILCDILPEVIREVKTVKSGTISNDRHLDRDLKKLEEETKGVADIWKEARNLKRDPSTPIRYELVGMLMRPGDLIVREDDLGSLWAYVMIGVSHSRERVRTSTSEKRFRRETEIAAWFLSWDEFENELGRQVVTFVVEEYSAQRPITSLPVYPISYASSKHGNDIKSALAKRGQKWWELIKARTSCQAYNGPALAHRIDPDTRSRITMAQTTKVYRRPKPDDNGRRVRIDERIVIDSEAKLIMPMNALAGESEERGDQRYRDVFDSRPEYAWDSLDKETKLTAEQKMLCPPIIGCYSVKSKDYFTVSVEKLNDVDWNTDAMDDLVLQEKRKSMLKGLVSHHYSPQNRKLQGDLIAGKGHSLVILLHGPPGVGKTLTAECIAEAVRKPLVALSIGDLVRDEQRLEERLQIEFKRAADWDAILLLDEADVVLEARSFEDVRRNAIVSVFLRQLEYYNGVLFLTTNRVSTMDTAFQSRIQIGIGFDHMTPDIRYKVWLRLLALNGRDKAIGQHGLREVEQKLSKFQLNGRQIRNVLNVAEGLAYEASSKLEYKHIKEATEATVEFQKYLEESKLSMKTEQTVWAPYRGSDNEFSFA